MLLKKLETEAILKVKCPKCGSANTSFYKFNKTPIINEKTRIRCNDCFEIHKLGECELARIKLVELLNEEVG